MNNLSRGYYSRKKELTGTINQDEEKEEKAVKSKNPVPVEQNNVTSSYYSRAKELGYNSTPDAQQQARNAAADILLQRAGGTAQYGRAPKQRTASGSYEPAYKTLSGETGQTHGKTWADYVIDAYAPQATQDFSTLTKSTNGGFSGNSGKFYNEAQEQGQRELSALRQRYTAFVNIPDAQKPTGWTKQAEVMRKQIADKEQELHGMGLDTRTASQYAGDVIGGMASGFEAMLASPLASIDKADYWLGRKLGLISPDDEYAYRMAHGQAQGIEQDVQNAKQNLGPWGRRLVDAAGAAGNVVGSTLMFNASGIPQAAQTVLAPVAASMSAAEAGVGATLGQRALAAGTRFAGNVLGDVVANPTNLAISAQSGLNTFDRAMSAGASYSNATVAGIASGMLEYMSNKMFSGTPLEDAPGEKGYVVELMENAAKKLGKEDFFKKVFGNAVVSMIMDKSGEGLEEVITGIGDPLIERLTYNPDADLATFESLLEDYMGGVLMSVVMGIPEKIGNIRSNVQAQRIVRQIEEQQRIGEEEAWKHLLNALADAAKDMGQAQEAQNTETADILTRLATEMAAEQIGAAEDAEPVDVLPGRMDDLTPETIEPPRPAPQSPAIAPPRPTVPQERISEPEASRDTSEEKPAQKPTQTATGDVKAPAQKPSGNYFVSGEKNNLPYDVVVERIPDSEATAPAQSEAPYRGENYEQRTEIQRKADELTRILGTSNVYTQDGYEYSVRYTPGANTFTAQIRNIGNDKMGGMISDGRSVMFNQTFPTRQAAIEALAGVAQNNGLLGTVQKPVAPAAQGGYNETKKPATGVEEKAVDEKQKEGVSNGGNDAGVDSGREDIRRGGSGRRGLPDAGHAPETEGSVPGDRGRGASSVQSDEGRSGGAGTRGGRSDDSVRSEPGGNAGSAGARDGQTVPGLAGGYRGSGEPGLSAGADDGGNRRVTREKPKNRKNYRITEDIDSKRPNFNDNVSAIKLMKELMESGRKPTAEEMATLAKFKGWGGLKDILVEGSYYNRQLKSILTPEEMNAAKLSTLNAHYTSTKVINAMYDAVKRLGFNGGRVLEPSMGVGNFFGAMPDKLSRASDLYGVELDSITGNIAKLLYPDAKIDVAGFQDVLYTDDTFDLVIGNVPFSNDIKIPYRNTTYNLHDFFFVKALDETRPGGIVALITSTGTLDKISGKTQKAIADRANLVAAFRLPDDAFKTNAGTEVTTDLIFLQKKGGGIEDNGVVFQKIGELDGIPINEYYVSHPKNILGTLSREKGMYANERTVVHGSGEDMQAVLSKAIKTLPKDIMNGGSAAAKPVTVRKRGQRSKASFTANADGSVTITDSGTGEVIEYGNATKAEKEKAQTIKDYIGLKNTFLDLLETEARGDNGSALRDKLNTQYDDFKKNHGALTSRDNKKLLSPDGDYIRTTGLEVKAKDGVEKSDIFRVPTVSKTRKTHADTAEEALSVSLNESGGIDLDRMAELTGDTKEQLLKALEDEIIQTPDGDYQLVAQYASGNIYQKLDQIKGRPGFDRQRKLLESVLPRPKTAAEIDATFGAHWIAPEYVRDFIRELFETNATVKFSRELGKWDVQMGWSGVRRFSTDRVSAKEIVENTLNGKNIEVKDKLSDGSKVLNEAETKLAQAKQEDLREAFRNWAFKDKSRAEALIDTFNRSLNAYAPMNYDALADRIDFGVNPASRKQPRPYQKAAAARIVFGGNTLLHNGVGTGKTLTMIIAAHAMKQAGIAQKPMLVVPNGKVEDFRSEILEAYPDAKILALDNDAMSPKQIQSTKAMIATGDWDYVIVFRTAFQRLPLSPEAEAQMLQRQLDLYEDAARDIAGDRNGNKRFEKGLQARIETLKNRIQKVLDKQKDDSVFFDDMGIDALFIDEAHNYKKVGFPTTFQFSGIVADTNDITTDLYMKEEYLRDRGERIVLATATPITNAISEMYNMAMHVAPEVYRDAGIYSFDTWANTFVNIESQPEIASDGKTYRRKERARNFKNANALFALYRQFADIKQTKDYVEGLPEAEYVIVKSEGTDLHKQILSYLSSLPADKTLQMNNDGKAAASDLRLVTDLLSEMGLDMTAEELDLPGSKINKAVAAIVDEYQKSSDIRGTQFVFLDSGVNSSGTRYHYNLYDDLVKKLVKAGIPKSEIAKIGDYDGEDKRQILYDKMNNGEIRVLIGSTAKMGEGVNAQQRAVALHHLSVPYRPDNLEQREGRIVRSGNMNKNVRIYKYIQEESYDSYLWQMIERKAAYLAEAYNGGDATEVDELSDAQVSAREAKAIATGNPLIMEKMNLQDKISRLRILYRGWQGEQYDAPRDIERYRALMIDAANRAKNAEADIKTYQAAAEKAGDKFTITIGNKTFDNRKDAAEALGKALEKNESGKIGTVYGLSFGTEFDYSLNQYRFYVRGKNEYYNSIGDSPAGNLTRIANLAEKGPVSTKASAERSIKTYEAAIRDAQQTLKTPFKQKAELEQAQARMKEIDRELGITDSAEIVSEAEPEQSVRQSRDAGISTHPEEWTTTRVGDKSKKPKPLSDIIEQIRHDYGINITTGHVRGAGVRGQYNEQDQGIRSRVANDLPVIAHELGHHLDDLYGLVDNLPESAKTEYDELINNMSAEFKERYKDKDKEHPYEGVAEYVRRFIQNSETAKIDYPEFTKYFLNSLSGPDMAKFMQLADEVNAYYSLDAESATSSIRLREEKLPDARTLTEKARDKFGVFYQAFNDSNYSVKRFQEATTDRYDVYKLATNSAYAGNRAAAAVTGDLFDKDGAYVCPGLKSCFANHKEFLTDKSLYRLLGEYLVVKHGPERLAEGKRTFADDRKNSTAWMQRRQAELERQHPELREISEKLYTFQRQFLHTWGVETGLVSEDTYKEWGDRWQFYVPFNRAVDEKQRGIGARRGFANQNSTIHMAIGSGLDILHPVDNIINNMVKMINAGIRNDVMQRITYSASTMGDANFIEKIQKSKETTVNIEPVKKELKKYGDEALLHALFDEKAAAVFETIVDSIDDVLKVYGRGVAAGNEVTVLKNGKPEFWKVNDPGLLASITNMAPAKMGAVLEAISTVNRFMVGNITGNNIIWSLFSNFPRDIMTLFTYLPGSKNPAKVFAAMGSAYVNKMRGDHADPLYMEYLAMGGGSTNAYTADRDMVKRAREKLAGKKISANPLDWIAFTSDMIEMGPRFATYKLMRNNGMNPHEAFYEAMDVTVNFKRGGIVSRELNKYIPFFNASVQGLDKFARWITAQDIPKAERAKVCRSRTVGWIAVSAALGALFYVLNNYDDERKKEYHKLSNYTKNSYWNVPLPMPGKYFSIPKPRELAVLSSFFETMAEYFHGKNEYAFDEFYEYFTDTTLPNALADVAQGDWHAALGSLGFIGTVYYTLSNKDFLGRPIVAAGLQNLSPKKKYDQTTSKLAWAIGQVFNVSPKKVDFFFQQTLGGWWKAQKALFPIGSENVDLTLGVQNTYIKDNAYSQDIVNRLYDYADASEIAYNDDRENTENAILAKRDERMTEFYSEYLKRSKENTDSVASRSTRVEVLDMILEYEKSREDGATTRAERAVWSIIEKYGDPGEYLPSVMSSSIKDGKGKTRILSDAQYVEYQTDYLRIYWATVEDALPAATSSEEKAQIIRKAKEVAKDQATNRTLHRIGAPVTDYEEKYSGVSNEDVATFLALKKLAGDDGSMTQQEVIDILKRMQENGLENDDAARLYQAANSSWTEKNNPWRWYLK